MSWASLTVPSVQNLSWKVFKFLSANAPCCQVHCQKLSEITTTHLPTWSRYKLGETYTPGICSTVHPASLPSAKPALRTPTLAMSFSAATQQTVSFWLWSVLGRHFWRPQNRDRNRSPTKSYKLNISVFGMNTTQNPARHLRFWKQCNYRDTYHINCFRILAISSILQNFKEIWLDYIGLKLDWALVTHLKYAKKNV